MIDPEKALVKTALIYKTELLPVSETFIQAQAVALRSFHPRFAGLMLAEKSLPLPHDVILATRDRSALSRTRVHLYRLFGFAPKFLRELQNAAPSLIHSHFATESVTALPIARHLNVPLIVTLHGADVTVRDSTYTRSLGGRLYLHRRSQLWRRASIFICVSDFIRSKAIKAGFPEDKLRVHFIGIDRSRFSPTNKATQDKVLFVGRLTEKKGCRYLLQAMKIVQERRPEAHLTIIGVGPERQTLEALGAQLKVACTFLGAQPSEVVRSHLASAAVFCVPSVTAANGDSEGLGMVFAEAQAMGVPVASFRHGGIPEVVLHGVTGLLAPEGDYVQLAENILTCLQDDAMRARLIRHGIEWIGRRFDIVTQTAELEEIYEEVLVTYSKRSGVAVD